MSDRTAEWLADPALRRIWAVLADRLATRGRRADGRIVISGLDREERHAVSSLLGRAVTAERVSIDLAALDSVLARRSGIGGLVVVAEAMTGAAVPDRPGERARRAEDRAAPFELARQLLGDHPWAGEWISDVRRSGVLARTGDPVAAVRCAVEALHRLPEPIARTELASATGGSAHALDDGTAAAALVLRGLAARAGAQPPTSTSARRALWERFGVRTDLVSTTCLTLGLRGTGPVGERLALAAEAGDPMHLTAWDLRRGGLVAPADVLVCENPRVLEAAAERSGTAAPIVCTSGRPALVVLDVLRALRPARLRYHGDFDWPGIAIANSLVADIGVEPWRMGVTDYEAAVTPGLPGLAGDPVEPTWDSELGAAMRRYATAVHEELLLDTVLP